MVDEPLLELLRQLRALGYEFTAITPASHARVLARVPTGRPTLRDIFGWNRRFASHDLDPKLLSLLEAADAVDKVGSELRAKLRVASFDGSLLLHSSFPTDQADSVFFGPDTYRFARFIRQQLPRLRRPAWIVDMGAGSGAGGILAARASPASRVSLVDLNQAALKLAHTNALFAQVQVETIASDAMPAGADLVIANPPYMIDASKRVYRDGGELLGGAVALNWAQQALASMAPCGVMLLYTGAAYKEGSALLVDALQHLCAGAGAALQLEELDPDVFGEELDNAAYAKVERIAVIGAVITKAAAQS